MDNNNSSSTTTSSNPTVSWDYDIGGMNHGYTSARMEQQLRRMEEEAAQPPLPIPPRTTMAARWAFRQGIRDETLQHRRIHHRNISSTTRTNPNLSENLPQGGGGGSGGGTADVATGRNISFVLRDRETYGAQRLIHHPRRRPEPAPGVKVATLGGAAATSTTAAAATPTKPPTNTTTSFGGGKRRMDEVDSVDNERGAAAMDTSTTTATPPPPPPPEGDSLTKNDTLTASNLVGGADSGGTTPAVANTTATAPITNGEPQAMNRNLPQQEGGSMAEGTPAITTTTKTPLLQRVCYPMSISHEIRTFAEYCSVIRYHSAFFHHLGGEDERGEQGERPSSSRAVSTISIAFSPDSQTMASTHGDHTVKITCCSTGRLLETLDGHPRTPWTVKYHPTNPHIVASGCLGHQVRLWNWKDKVCLQMIRLEFAIISLSFHPAGQILAIANGTKLHFWGFEANTAMASPNNQNNNNASQQQQQRQGSSNPQPSQQQQQPQNPQPPRSYRGMLTEVEQRHMLRCVHFPPGGTTIIVGGVNPQAEDPRRTGRSGVSGGGMSFYLRLWDFDVDAALHPFGAGQNSPSEGGGGASSLGVRRRAISNPRTFVPRALLYNDGGFDVSPDGKVLCACAEYWLPDGVDNAMELLHREERVDDDESDDDDDSESIEDADMNNNDNVGTTTPSRNPISGDNQDTNDNSTSANTNFDSSSNQSPPRFRTPTPSPAPQSNTAPAASTFGFQFVPRTPPTRAHLTLSPPSPPGRRFTGGLGQQQQSQGAGRGSLGSGAAGGGRTAGGSGGGSRGTGGQPPPNAENQNSGTAIPPPPPPPPAPSMANRPPHPLSIICGGTNYPDVAQQHGRYVPHVVTISLDTAPVTAHVEGMLAPGRGGKVTSVARGYRPRLGQLLEACPLDGAKASAVTCVKFSPSTDFCLIGYGVREPVAESGGQYHPVTALYRIRGGMTHVSTMLSGDDDVNIARFHPDSGYGFVYGTKQGRVRVLSPRPWNYYNC